MAKRLILKFILSVAASPLTVLSRMAMKYNWDGVTTDLNRCAEIVVGVKCVPEFLLEALRIAEDRRNELHPGVDLLGILRAICAFIFKGRVQGGSTIEQQFVRTISERYEKTLYRKLREQLIAVAISRLFSKTNVASAYLNVAFFGVGLRGLATVANAYGTDANALNRQAMLEIVARLKYPQPHIMTYEWKEKIMNRCKYVRRGMSTSAGQQEKGCETFLLLANY